MGFRSSLWSRGLSVGAGGGGAGGGGGGGGGGISVRRLINSSHSSSSDRNQNTENTFEIDPVLGFEDYFQKFMIAS